MRIIYIKYLGNDCCSWKFWVVVVVFLIYKKIIVFVKFNKNEEW